MKPIWALISVITVAVLGAFLWSALFAAGQSAGSNVDVMATKQAGGDLLMRGREVTVRSPVQGDLAAAGSSVTLYEPVEGYAMTAGANVDIRGQVADDLWAAGRDVALHAPVGDNAILAGNTVTIDPRAAIGGDATIAARTVSAKGRVARDLSVTAQEAQLSGEVGGSVTAHVARLRVLPGAIIHGDLNVYGARAPEIAPGAQVQGRVQFNREAGGGAWGPLAWLGRWAFLLLSSFVLGAVVLLLFPEWPERVAQSLKRKPLSALALGAAGLLLVPAASALLAISLLGLPAAVVLMASWLSAVLLSHVFIAYEIGAFLLARMHRSSAGPFARFGAGAIVVTCAISLPWIGWIAQIAVVVFGLGALAVERRSAYGPTLPAHA